MKFFNEKIIRFLTGFLLLVFLGFAFGCSKASPGVEDPDPEFTPPIATPAPPLEVDFSDAFSLFTLSEDDLGVGNESLLQANNLRKVTLLSQILPVITTAEDDAVPPDVSQISFRQNGEIFLLFESAVREVESDETCILIKVTDNTSYECVDTGLDEVFWPDNSQCFTHEGIQIDNEDGLYYLARTGEEWNLKKKTQAGEISTLSTFTDVAFNDFRIIGVNEVVLSGSHTLDNTFFFERLNPDGSVEELVPNNEIRFFELFPDNNIYAGTTLDDVTGLWKFLLEEDPVVRMLADETLGPSIQENLACQTDLFRSINNKVYGLSLIETGSSEGQQHLYRLFPEISKIESDIVDYRVIHGEINNIIAGGTDTDGIHRLLFLQVDSSQPDIDLLSGNIEVFHIGTDGQSIIYFDGRRVSDDTFIIGRISEILDGDGGFGLNELTDLNDELLNFVFKTGQ